MLHTRIFNLANMSFNVIRENEILAKISEFTIHKVRYYCLTFVTLANKAIVNMCKTTSSKRPKTGFQDKLSITF